MRLGKIGLAAVIAAAAFATAPGAAQAQEPLGVCVESTGTLLDGRCAPVYLDERGNPCTRQYCVSGLMENVNAAIELAWGLVPKVDDVLPLCTPNLLSGPICVG